MKSQINYPEYQRLELVSESPTQKKNRRSLSSKLNNIWQMAIAYLEMSSEPRVWQTREAGDRITWSAYDAVTQDSISQVSASEMRTWLEERHYQNDLTADQKIQQFKIQQLYNLR